MLHWTAPKARLFEQQKEYGFGDLKISLKFTNYCTSHHLPSIRLSGASLIHVTIVCCPLNGPQKPKIYQPIETRQDTDTILKYRKLLLLFPSSERDKFTLLIATAEFLRNRFYLFFCVRKEAVVEPG